MAGEISAAVAHLPAEKALRWSYFLAPAGEGTCVRVLRELKMDNDTIDKAKILSRFAFMQMEPEESAVRHAMILSDKHQNLFDYFKQLFAQVTNPPIDAIREEVVTSTTVYIGADGNLLEEKAENCKMLKVNNPILTNVDLLKIKNMKHKCIWMDSHVKMDE